jgi:hypothetical protein
MDFSSEPSDAAERTSMGDASRLKDHLLRTQLRYFILLAAVFLLGNLILPRQFWFRGPNTLGAYSALFLSGALTTQLGLLATRCSMSGRTNFDSLIVSSLLVLLVWSSYMAGLRLADADIPLEPSLFLLGLAFIGFAIAQISLRQISLHVRWVIRHRSDTTPFDQNAQPMSIKFLMLATAAVAIAIFLIKLSLPVDKSAGWPPKLKVMIIGSALVLGFSIAIHTVVAFITLGERLRWVGLTWLVLGLALMPIAYALALQLFTRELIYNDLQWAYSYFLGHTFFTLFSFLILRWLGYRSRWLENMGQENEETPGASTPFDFGVVDGSRRPSNPGT